MWGDQLAGRWHVHLASLGGLQETHRRKPPSDHGGRRARRGHELGPGLEAFAGFSVLEQVKKREGFSHRNASSISRMKIRL